MYFCNPSLFQSPSIVTNVPLDLDQTPHTINTMFWSRPPKYNGPINGRDIREKVPSDFVLPDKDENEEQYKDALEYLSIYDQEERAKVLSMVYACPKCEVRIANEEDMVTRPYVRCNGDISLVAVFKQTYNLVRRENSVCCYRCGSGLFDYCAHDPFLLAIPMFKAHNERTLLKREYRFLCLTFTSAPSLFALPWCDPKSDGFQEYSVAEKIKLLKHGDYPKFAGTAAVKEVFRRVRLLSDLLGMGKKVYITRLVVFDAAGTDYRELKAKPDLEKRILTNLARVHSDFGAEFVYIEELENASAFQRDKTYDFALLFRTGLAERKYIAHTDHNDYHIPGLEKLHILPWLTSGGNFLFADWGSYDEDAPPDDYLDHAKEAEKWAVIKEGTNKQPAFAKLITDGHFIGRWSMRSTKINEDGSDFLLNEPTEKMVAKMELALAGKLLYPNWLFLHDYPPSVFTNLKRAMRKVPFSSTVRDFYEPPVFTKEKKSSISLLPFAPSLIEILNKFGIGASAPNQPTNTLGST